MAFKSIIAYRTGLDVREWSRDEARAAFERWRADGWRESREHAKPVRDALLRRTFEVAAAAGGLPDPHPLRRRRPGIVLGHARPQDLFPLLSERMHQPVVLIHSGQPWLDEGAYVASILPHVYLEMSITMPWASLAIDTKLEALLGIAPPSKVLYGSDEATEPEVLWLSALVGREALERVLGRPWSGGWLEPARPGPSAPACSAATPRGCTASRCSRASAAAPSPGTSRARAPARWRCAGGTPRRPAGARRSGCAWRPTR